MNLKKIPIKVIVIIGFLAIAVIVGIYLHFVLKIGKIENPGIFGDMFGGLNALFSGIALLGVILTTYLQSRELELQRKELELTRQEIHAQQQEMEKQTETFMFQRFENTFFNLLKTFNDLIASIELRRETSNTKEVIATGRDCFRVFCREFKEFYTNDGRNKPKENDVNQTGYLTFHNKYESKVGHYFRHMYNTVKFIDSSKIKGKQFYVEIIRAQLSTNEHLLIFYNTLSPYGVCEFKPLIEKYHFFKNLKDEYLLHPSQSAFYSRFAFEEPKEKTDTI